MPDFLVYPHYPGGQIGTMPQLIQAEDATAAAEQFYMHSIVVPCEVFPRRPTDDDR